MSGRGREGRRGGDFGRRGGRKQGNLPGVCRHYSSPKGCVKEDSCNFLHMCRNLFNDEGCRFGRRCRYNHDFTADQPSEILGKHRIDPNLDFQELMDLFRPRVQAQFAPKKSVQNEDGEFERNAEEDETSDDTMSQVSDLGPALRFHTYSREYDDDEPRFHPYPRGNDDNEPRSYPKSDDNEPHFHPYPRGNDDNEPRFHPYPRGNDDNEPRSYSKSDDNEPHFHPYPRGNDDNEPRFHTYSQEYDDSDEDGTSSVASALNTKSNKRNRRRNRRRKPRNQNQQDATNDINEINEAVEENQPSDLQEKVEICSFHVKGHCSNGKDCPKLHGPSRLPYKWQYKKDEQWINFKAHNQKIEAIFCDPSNNEMKIKIRNVPYTIEFDTMTMLKTSLDYDEIRRLSTMPAAKNQIKNMRPYCTHWIWYWEDDGIWREYSNEYAPNQYSKTDSTFLERAYQDNLLRKTSIRILKFSSSGNSIDFDDMVLTTHEQEKISICRRPKLYEPIIKDKTPSQKEAVGGKEKKSVPQSGKETSSAKVKTQQAAKKRNKIPKKSQEGTSNGSTRTEQSKNTTMVQQEKSMDEQGAATGGAKSAIATVEKPNNATIKTKSRVQQHHANLPEEIKENKHIGARPKQIKMPVVTEPIEQKPYWEPIQNATTSSVLNPQPPKPEKVVKRRCSWSDDNAHEICISELRGKCKYGDGCMRLHGKFPFQWQYKDLLDRWTNYDDEKNQFIEKTFSSDPSVMGMWNFHDSPGLFTFDMLTVTTDCHKCLDEKAVRRLSTRSTVSCDSSYLEPYCIEWQWYWMDDGKKNWVQYAQKSQKGSHSFVNGDQLEVAYESYLRGEGPSVFQFETQEQTYELDFETMMQRNLVYQTQRPVGRRPKFLSMAERKQIASELQQQEKHFGTRNVPKTWNTKGMRQHQPMIVPLDIGRHSDEYMKVADMFWNTMDENNGTICAIKRVQNFELWEYYSIAKEHMKKKNKGSVVEKQLWHGTSKESSDAISRQNFDFRISGSNVGTLYGQGSYFASNAKYSDGYTKPENHVRRMFLARVLIGRFVKGEHSYKRPPPVNPKEPSGDLYDSCVNDEQDPSIYVTFERSQAYPEYLIEYKRSSDISSPSTVPNTSVPKASNYNKSYTPRPAPSQWNSSTPASRSSYPSYSSTNVSATSNPSRPIRNYQNVPHYNSPSQASPARSSSSSSISSASNLVRSSSDFGMGRASPSAPIWDDITDSYSSSRRRASEQLSHPQKSPENKTTCCIQ